MLRVKPYIQDTDRTKDIPLYWLKILQHVLKTVDIDTETHQIFLSQGITSSGKLLNTKDFAYLSMVENAHYKFFLAEMDKRIIL